MSSSSVNNKRIAKNTLFLYFRMILMMVISLYTSRVILNALGAEDFGIYNLVGGLIAMFTAISGTLEAAIRRFITYELGKGDIEKLKKVFSTSLCLQFGLIIILFVLAESIGVWYLNNKLVIPEDRVVAANWCFQFSIISFSVGLFSLPYHAAIVAHEKMSAFAYMAILESIGKLLIAFSISIVGFDRLIFYGALIMAFTLLIAIIYLIYCRFYFEECVFRLIYDKELVKNIFGFVGWAFIGVTSCALKINGVVILINTFFGPIVNAAYAISMQVERAVSGFVANFMMALSPQITKSYATGNLDYMKLLIFQGARFSYYIMLILSLPIIINSHYILELWLKQVPDHTVYFVQLVLIMATLGCIQNPLSAAQIATGKIKKYQIVVGGIDLLNLPVSYVCLYYWAIPESVVIVSLLISQACLVAGLFILRGMIGLSVKDYFFKVYTNILKVSLGALLLPFLTKCFIPGYSFLYFVLLTLLCFACTIISELYIGCNGEERKLLYTKIRHLKK